MLDESVKNIYNIYLRSIRTAQDKPFRYRKDFTKFEDEKVIVCSRLARFFKDCEHINPEDFFKAPFQLLDNFNPSLEFYASAKARRCYSITQKKLLNSPPDSEYQLNFTKDSFKFLIQFCKENKISLQEYINNENFPPFWALHIKTKKINIYSLMAFDNIRDKIEKLDNDIGELYLGEIYKNYYVYKRAFMQSNKMRKLVDNAKRIAIIRINESSDSNKTRK
jgi:hypothetical protein